VKEIKKAGNEAVMRFSNVLIFKIIRHLKVLNLLRFKHTLLESIEFIGGF
jgi:hypothetical protein